MVLLTKFVKHTESCNSTMELAADYFCLQLNVTDICHRIRHNHGDGGKGDGVQISWHPPAEPLLMSASVTTYVRSHFL